MTAHNAPKKLNPSLFCSPFPVLSADDGSTNFLPELLALVLVPIFLRNSRVPLKLICFQPRSLGFSPLSLPHVGPVAPPGCRGTGLSIYNSSMVRLVFQLLRKLPSFLPHFAPSIFTSPVKSGRNQCCRLKRPASPVLGRGEKMTQEPGAVMHACHHPSCVGG